MIKKWRVIIVEDEIEQRHYLKNILKIRYEEIEIIGEAENTQQALELFNANKEIDGVFMDIHLEDNPTAGVDLAFRFKQRDNFPWLIFITGSPHHAVEVINLVRPDGYLLKPLDTGKLHSMLHYVLYERSKLPIIALPHESVIEITHKIITPQGEVNKVTEFIKPSNIAYVRKNQNVVSVQFKLINGIVLDGVTGSLEYWMKQLHHPYFFQIHRSYFINLQQAQSIHSHSFQKDTSQISFKCFADERLTIGETFYDKLVEKLKKCDW